MKFSLPSGITPTKRTIIIAIVVGVIAGFGSLLFYEGLKWGIAFFMGYLLQYVYPQEGQSVADDQPVVRTPFAHPPDPHPPIRESPDRDPCHPVRTRGRRSWHRCGDQGIPWRWQDTETGPGLKSCHGNSHHLDRGECREGRPCGPDLGGFWIRCRGYARPLPPRAEDCTHDRDRGRDRDHLQGSPWRGSACRRSPLHP